MALVVFLQDDEDVQSVYRNLKIFCETSPRAYRADTSTPSLCPPTTSIHTDAPRLRALPRKPFF